MIENVCGHILESAQACARGKERERGERERERESFSKNEIGRDGYRLIGVISMPFRTIRMR